MDHVCVSMASLFELMLAIDHPELAEVRPARVCIAFLEDLYRAGWPNVLVKLSADLDQLVSRHVFHHVIIFHVLHHVIIVVEDVGNRKAYLEAVLEKAFDEAVLTSQVEVEEPIVPLGVLGLMQPPDGHRNVLGSILHEHSDLFPSCLLCPSGALLLLFYLDIVLPLELSQHPLQLLHRDRGTVDPPSLHPVDILVAVTVHVLELFEFRAGDHRVIHHVIILKD